MNYQEILSHFTYDDSTDIRNRAAVAEAGDYRENRDIINEIVLWKMNRRPQVTEELIDAIFSLKEIKTPLQALEDEKTAQVIEKLLQTKGMQLPMASTVLHFYYPEVFPIIDQRAYRELYAMDYPKTMTKIPMLTELYLKYIKDCWEYQQEKCPGIALSRIEKVLYQLDKEKGNKVIYYCMLERKRRIPPTEGIVCGMEISMEYISDAQAKQMILEVGRRMYQGGFVAANDGNISCKVGDNEIWATPTGVSKGFMTEDMLVKLDLDGNVLEGTHKPSSEIKMHLRVFKENPKVQGVVHAHPLTATAFACAGISLEEPVLMEGVLSLGCVPLVHFALPGTEEVPEAVAPYCRDYNAVLLANHGALTWGDNLMQAYYRMETTEYYAKILMMNNFILGKKTLLSQGQIDDIIKIRAGWGITTGGRPIGPEGAQNLEDICISRKR